MPFYPAKTRLLSFELFPPKTPAGEEALYESVGKLLSFRPDVITCTYGAGGSTQAKTLEIVAKVRKQFGVKVASHLTCVGSTVDDLRDYLRRADVAGVQNIVALRGDPPKGEATFQMTDGGLRYANDLVALIHQEFPQFGIAVAGYPEVHQEAISAEADMENLKRKVDSGGDCVITQLFYDNADFFRFRDKAVAAGIHVPIIPGLLPVTNLAQIQRITSLCKARLPEPFIAQLAEKDDADWQFQAGVTQCIEQSQELLANDVPGLHFYVLNKSPATTAVLEAVGW